MTEGIPFDTNETCRYEGSPFTFNFSTSSCFLERVDGPDAGDNSGETKYSHHDSCNSFRHLCRLIGVYGSLLGEASLMGLEQVGLQASALGFVSEYLRVVVLSTDDAYKSPGFEFCECTSDHVPREHDCSCPNACTSAHCSRVPTLPEVRSALHDSRVTPIFAVAPLETSTDENRESNADILRQKYRDADLGGVVVELSQDSSNFIDVLVVGLGQILCVFFRAFFCECVRVCVLGSFFPNKTVSNPVSTGANCLFDCLSFAHSAANPIAGPRGRQPQTAMGFLSQTSACPPTSASRTPAGTGLHALTGHTTPMSANVRAATPERTASCRSISAARSRVPTAAHAPTPVPHQKPSRTNVTARRQPGSPATTAWKMRTSARARRARCGAGLHWDS